MPYQYIETFDEFSKKQGTDPLDCGHRFRWANGASCDRFASQFQDPSEDGWQRLHDQEAYYVEAEERAFSDFSECRVALGHRAAMAAKFQNQPPPDDADLTALTWRRDHLEDVRLHLAEIRKKIYNHPKSVEGRKMEDRYVESKERAQKVHSLINSPEFHVDSRIPVIAPWQDNKTVSTEE